MSQPRRRPGHRGLLYRVITRNLHQMIGLCCFSTEEAWFARTLLFLRGFPLAHSVETSARFEVGCQAESHTLCRSDE